MVSSDDGQRQDNIRDYGDDRVDLLETIREMVSQEVDRRLTATPHDPHPENPPPRKSPLKWLLGLLNINS